MKQLLLLLSFLYLIPAHASDYDLKSWRETSTGSTTQLFNQCGIIGEARLLDGRVTNYLALGFKNESASPKYYRGDEIKITFDTGTERIPVQAVTTGMKLESHVTEAVHFVLSEKADFKDAKIITVSIPVSESEQKKVDCTIQVRFNRNPDAPAGKEDYISYTKSEAWFGVGGVFHRGNVTSFASNGGVTLEAGAVYYPWLHDGFFLDLMFDTFSSTNFDAIGPGGTSIFGNTDTMNDSMFSVGYSRREFLSTRFMLDGKIGPGLYTLHYSRGDGSTNALAGLAQVSLVYRLSAVPIGYSSAVYSLGLSLNDVWVFHGKVNGNLDFSGQNLGAVLQLRVGL